MLASNPWKCTTSGRPATRHASLTRTPVGPYCARTTEGLNRRKAARYPSVISCSHGYLARKAGSVGEQESFTRPRRIELDLADANHATSVDSIQCRRTAWLPNCQS